MIKNVQIEFFADQDWQVVGSLSLMGDLSEDFRSPTRFEYNRDHAVAYLGRNDFPAVSCRMPVHFGITELQHWPPWALDLIPAGGAKLFWLNRLNLPDAPESLWPLLVHGASNPPGNLRVKEASSALETVDHPGFAIDDVVFMKEKFIDHCERHGHPFQEAQAPKERRKSFFLLRTKMGGGTLHVAYRRPTGKKNGWLSFLDIAMTRISGYWKLKQSITS